MKIFYLLILLVVSTSSCIKGNVAVKLDCGADDKTKYGACKTGAEVGFAITAPASPTTSNKIVLTWESSPGTTTYRAVVSNNPDCSEPLQEFTGLADTTAAFSGLQDEKTYYACVYSLRLNAPELRAKNAPYEIKIDISAPTISGVLSLVNDGYYRTDDLVDVSITFTKPVIVTGTPTLTMNGSSTSPKAVYLSGSGTNKLTFRYTIGYRDRSRDLDYASKDALELSGGTIIDEDGFAAVLTLPEPAATGSLSSNNALYINQPKGPIDTVSIGDLSACALTTDGKVKCWGYNGGGELGISSTTNMASSGANPLVSVPYVVLGQPAVQVSVGARHSCALLRNGDIKCWGMNTVGQLGQGNTTVVGDHPSRDIANLVAVNLGSGRSAIQVAAGGYHTCALLDNGAVKCWGANPVGQLGQDSAVSIGNTGTPSIADLSAVQLGADSKAVYVAAGGINSCAILESGALKCWGANLDGQLGQNNTTAVGDAPARTMANLLPINLGASRAAAHVSAGENHICAALDDGSAKCWGNNSVGQLGRDNTTSMGDSGATPMSSVGAINLGTDFFVKQVAAGYQFSCALSTQGLVKCWGANGNGQLGKNNMVSISNSGANTIVGLASVSLSKPAKEIAAAGRYFFTGSSVCVRLTDDGVQCWGSSMMGGLGRDNTTTVGDGSGDAMSTLYNLAL